MKRGLSLIFSFLLLLVARAYADTAFPLQASYVIDTAWPSGYQATVTLTNPSSTATSSWTAAFSLPDGQSISSLWNGAYTASGQNITVKNPTWIGGGTIPGEGSTTFGMIVQNPDSGTPALNGLLAMANGVPTPPPVPKAPVLNPVVISSSSPTSYLVSWNSVANAATYQLQQDITSAFSNPQVVAQGTALSYSAANQPNGTYFYRVAAINSSGISPYSNVQSVTVQVDLAAPILQPISNPTGNSQYLVSWSAVAGAQGYTLEESLTSDFSDPQIAYHGANTSYQASGKQPGQYYYRATAYSGVLTGPQSNIEEAIVTQQAPQTNAIVEGYWESWNSVDSINTIVNMHADVIDIAFANFNSTGTHTFAIAGLDCDQATLTQFIAAVHNAGKKVKLSIGGATYGLSGQLLTAQDAVGMAQAIASFVQGNNLDGVDFDIEDYPAPDLQIALLQNTRQLLGSQALISYTPKTPASTTYPYDQVIQGAHPYVNSISIMAYDYGPGYSYQQDIQALQNMGVPASKIIIGLMPGYDDLHVMTSLSDIQNAAEYVIANGLGGIMFWDLNRDHENLTGLGSDGATNTAWNILH
ncbi:glycosyl hydrolase family 18 protein [Candidatus Protochlamydia phocaeensis]|uniref:glycosyl hydrolase family 18 protein n=1 Tax=Candidatus Protochlamydia phocaeensis TaxID=1414722 RepID=UPI000838B268|nr:glycosyl hydrolase family 18 protein [Candidatus Protochlamydia phocaeensis]